MGNLTENFDRKEFACPCCGKQDIDEKIVNRLQVIRDITGIPIHVNSACRCIKHNEQVGGVNGSYHIAGQACDWCFKGGEDGLLEKLCTKLINNWSGGFHFYSERTLPDGTKQSAFCHCDIGPKRRW